MAQKNLLPLILLGLLRDSKKTGYELKKDFDTEIGEFWSVKHSQIYLELKRLTELGEINAVTGFFGSKVEKTYYEITKLGKERFFKWQCSFQNELAVNKDEFVLKLYFIKDKSDERLGQLLKNQYELHLEKLLHLRQRMKDVFSTIDKDNNYGHYLILNHAIKREEEYTQWLDDSLKYISVGEEK
ncbi:PadR family transcriptional regulator [Succinivibrio dextrinosolvens]|uniref:PadR family transcriptional regulator n=1 Tax=Succinivibrio dextrinosolvens TaxID=83771 RepID=UPI0004E0C715|nr:PadR family transcriptional regulator [Succinivibrio dextrinosolvens]